MTEERTQLSAKERAFLSTILLFIAIIIGIDILSDAKDGAGFGHMAIEVLAGATALFGYGLLIGRSFKAKAQIKKTNENLARVREEAEYWRSSSRIFIEGLSQAIDEQFKKWNFSPSEKEVALLFLKGLTSKEIASVRGVTDKTIRAQATTIYEKSGLAGRAELSAFFLEDLFSPSQTLQNRN